jgi:CxxC motif-containing protein (DUF1111 family)
MAARADRDTTVRMLGILLTVFTVLFACADPNKEVAQVPSEIFGPMGSIMPLMQGEWQSIFDEGEDLSLHRFDPNQGLGPKFNVTSCSGCHETPTAGGGGPLYRNFLIMGQRTTSNAFLLSGTRGGVYTFHHVDNIETETDARKVANVFATRNPIPFFGLGLISLVSDEDILSYEDPNDLNQDGISGRANFISGRVGRLGMKAQATNIEGFVRGPLMNHLGITSDPLSASQKAALPFATVTSTPSVQASGANLMQTRLAQVAAPNEPLIDDDAIDDPELAPADLFKLVSWAMLLAAPTPESPTSMTERGLGHFTNFGCADCHRPAMPSKIGLVPLYSDLLLHDMGDELADGLEMGFAQGSEFRTAPLWGVVATGPFLHDGRALTIHEAILAHGGEARTSQEAYANASSEVQSEVFEFLASLGGRSVTSAGLLPPSAPLPTSVELGGPYESLTGDALEDWSEGLILFDRNFGFAEGIGEQFNGDSCRACHFLGAVGGAGPIDVDVQHIIGGGMPSQVRHEHHATPHLPTLVPASAMLERRNTPALFGLGVLEQITEVYLGTIADPADADNDGISGRISYTTNMKVGRFGWRADNHSLKDFVQGALKTELGLDPANPDHAELYGELTTKITLYLAGLSHPPMARTLDIPQVFTNAGCVDCHRDDLPIDGAVQPLTDLLVHDVGSGHFETGDLRNDYRTAPLWGLGDSAPYMHDGRSATIEEAILMHDGEAASSRIAYQTLTVEQQLELLEFLRQR